MDLAAILAFWLAVPVLIAALRGAKNVLDWLDRKAQDREDRRP